MGQKNSSEFYEQILFCQTSFLELLSGGRRYLDIKESFTSVRKFYNITDGKVLYMTVLKIQNCYSWLKTENVKLHEKLWNALRFREKGYQHSTAYKRRVWDGFRDFYARNSGMFLTGLLPEILAALKLFKVEYEIVDERNTPSWKYTSIDKFFLNQFRTETHAEDGSLLEPLELHDYQVDYVNQALKYGRGIIKAPTGAGKTFILISLLKALPDNTPVLFMTKNAGLVKQNYEEMVQWGVQNLGRCFGKYKEFNRVMCITAHKDSLKSIEKLLPKFKVLIVDEVHECTSAVPLRAFDKMTSAAIRFGISATPFKFTKLNKDGTEDCKDKVQKYKVKGYFGGVFKTTTTKTGYLTTKDLQERGILSRSNCTFYSIHEPKNIQNEPYIDAVTLGISNNFDFLKTVRKLTLTLTGRTLILVERIDQGDYLNQLIPDSFWISGETDLDERANVFKELKYGDNRIAIAMRHIITAGINVFVHNLINASGGQAEHSIVQQMGRGLRCAKDKEYLDYYDFLFRTNDYLLKHSMNRLKVLENEGHKITVKELDF